MPGKKITDHQVHKFKQHRNTLTQVAAAARAGISERSARRIDGTDALPSQRPSRSWRTREDPLAEVWDAEVVPLLRDRRLAQRRHAARRASAPPPGPVRHRRAAHPATPDAPMARHCTAPSARSTSRRNTRQAGWACRTSPSADDLERRDRRRAVPTPAVPVRACSLGLASCRGQRRVARASSRCLAGCRLRCGAWVACPRNTAPTACRPAFNNLAEQRDADRKRYDDLCRHYGMRASRCNPGQSHENGSIESRHDSLKTALDQALRLRGSRAFDDRPGYEAFVDLIVQRFNVPATKRLAVERPMLKSLPTCGAPPSTRNCRPG